MKKKFPIVIFIILNVFILFVSICTLPSPPEPLKLLKPHAFLGDTVNSISHFNDTAKLAVCDTVQAGDSLYFIGIEDTAGKPFSVLIWDFGDGMSDTGKIFNHAYKENGSYTAVFSGFTGAGEFLSDTVVVYVNTRPSLQILKDTVVIAGAPIEFSVLSEDPDNDSLAVVSGTLPDGAEFNSSTGLFQWTPTTGQVGSYTITFEISDGLYTIVDSTLITVQELPGIISKDIAMNRCPGDSAVISVNASGSAPLSFEWYKDGTLIKEASSCSLIIASITEADTGIYNCRVSNSVGSATSLPCTLSVQTPIVFVSQPDEQLICIGDTARFSVTVSGSEPFSYQWRKNGKKIDGKTDSVFTIASVAPKDSGIYSCEVTNSCGLLTSNQAVLKINSPSTAAKGISKTASTVCPGAPVTLTVTGGSLGAGALWKWYSGSCNGDAIGEGSALTVNPASTTTYYVRAEGTCNISDCVSAVVNVKKESEMPDEITVSKSTICLGDSTLLTIKGGSLGTGASWEWYSGSCSGGTFLATGNSIIVKPTVTTSYSVRGRGDCNSTDWMCTSITVTSPSTAPSVKAGEKTICKGDSTVLTITGGTLGTGAKWRWYSDSCTNKTSVGEGTTITVSPDVSTVYYVRAEGDCNVSSCANITVFVDSLSVTPTGVTASEPAVCSGSPTKLTVKGGKLGSGGKWKWYKGSCSGTPVDSGVSITISPVSETTYYVRAEGTCNVTDCVHCTVTMKSVSSAPKSVIANPTSVCPGTEATLMVIEGTLGTGANWVWYAGACDGTPAGTGANIEVAPTATTTYYVRAEGDCGKSNCKTVTVSVNSVSVAPDSIIPASTNICPGSPVLLQISGGILGIGATWHWYTGSCNGTDVGTGSQLTVSPESNTTYYVRAEGICGNTSCCSTSVTVNVSSIAQASILVSSDTICQGDSTKLKVSGGSLGTGAEWVWYSGSCNGTLVGKGSQIAVKPQSTTIYYVRAEGVCGNTSCLNSTITVKTRSIAPASITPSAITICSSGHATLQVNGGSLGTGATWRWYRGSCNGTFVGSGSSISVSVAGTYYVRAEGSCEGPTVCRSATVTVDGSSYCKSTASSESTLSKVYQMDDF